MKEHTHVIRLTFAALFAALIALATIALAFPVGTGAYINPGDAMIYTAAWFLGPIAGTAAAIGSGLADLILGYVTYIPATVVIKGIMGVVVGLLIKRHRQKLMPMILAMSVGSLIMAVGYFLYEYFASSLLGIPKVAALGNVPANLIQAVGGVIIGTLVIGALSKIKGINGFVDRLKGKE